jgi:hypothetical protein
MTYKTCQNIYSEHCHVLLERYQEGVACVVQQMRMSDIYDQKEGTNLWLKPTII